MATRFEKLRAMANKNTSGLRQVNISRSPQGSGASINVRLGDGLVIRADVRDWRELRADVRKWKKAQGLPMCINGSPAGFVSEERLSRG